jgi:hypothetical protein
VGEHRDEVTAAARSSASKLLSIFVGLDRNPGGAIYGVITVGAVLAAEGSRNETYPRSVGAAILVLSLYWVAHAWSSDSGDRLASRRRFTWPPFATMLRNDSSIVRGATVPIIAVIVAGLSGMSDQNAELLGTVIAAAMLVVIEFVAAMSDRIDARQVILQTCAGALFGCALIALRFVLV